MLRTILFTACKRFHSVHEGSVIVPPGARPPGPDPLGPDTPATKEGVTHPIRMLSCFLILLSCLTPYELHLLLPPAHKVWGKVRFSEMSVILLTWGRGVSLWGVCIQGGLPTEGLGRPLPGTRKVGGTHPTGMLSCLNSVQIKIKRNCVALDSPTF